MLDRIEQIHDAAVAEIESAGTAASLEELRVKHLGRKAELPNLLRGVAQLPPEGAARSASAPTRSGASSRR